MKKYRTIIHFAALFAITAFLMYGCTKEVDPPVASFTYEPEVGDVNDPINFDASESDPGTCDNCQIVKYYWDWENDGNWDLITESSTASHEYNAADTYTVALKVRNSQGYTNAETVTRDIEVGGGGSNQSPSKPSVASPPNGVAGAPTSPTLSWSASDPDGDPLLYDIYLGVNSPPQLIKQNHESTTYESSQLEENTTYFWKIVAKDNNGGETAGNVWSFTTEGTGPGVNRPPNPPTSPYPEPYSQNRPLNQLLEWEASDPNGDDLRYEVFFGQTEEPPLVAVDITSNSHNPGGADGLEPNTTYYWKIKAKDADTVTESELWQFTTGTSTLTCPSEITDPRNGNSYKTVQIGMQCWMAENLNYGELLEGGTPSDNNLAEKFCYDDNEANCDEFGALYQWDEMMNYVDNEEITAICPEGWHIPSEKEWHRLVNYLGGNFEAGGKLKVGGSTGFDALMSGTRNSGGTYEMLNLKGFYWSSTSQEGDKAMQVHFDNNLNGVYYNYKDKGYSNALRCVKN